MSYNNIPFKSYCWSIGTTSFRTKQHNLSIEKQLILLNEFWQKPEFSTQNWSGNNDLQSQYYSFLLEREFVTGNASRPAKDAREMTSGLKDLGLINEERRLTEVGINLLEISLSGDFKANNPLKLQKDSYIYTKQLLKTCKELNDGCVRAYTVLIYLISKLSYLSEEEFTYFAPICINQEITESMISKIQLYRTGNLSIEHVLAETVLTFDNYINAKNLLLQNQVDDDLICTIGMNRKSRAYDKPYYPFYKKLKAICVDKDLSKVNELYEATKALKLKTHWRKFLFSSISRNSLINNPESCLNNERIFDVDNEEDFKNIFFNKLHLFKIKATLEDYMDLNKRYLKATDTLIFDDNKVVFDIIPKYFYKNVADNLLEEAFEQHELLTTDCSLEEISTCLVFNEEQIYAEIERETGISIESDSDIKNLLINERLNRFNSLIDEKFDNEILLTLLNCFETRNDNEIYKLVTENANIPTIFEYILGIIWYKISDYEGNILDFMKLSLEADLLPKSHACGGEADIVYEYEETENYPKHEMLIEATLMDDSSQRRNEMEPASRHLGNNILNTGNDNSYCTFISPYLDINVLNHFRNLKHMGYYDPRNTNRHVSSLKVIPIKINELKTILQRNIKYKELYEIFENAYNSNAPTHNWYDQALIANL